MRRRVEILLLAALILGLAVVLYSTFQSRVTGTAGSLNTDAQFKPLEVEEPQLRLQLLEKIRKLEYSGSRRNIFVASLPPKPTKPSEKVVPFPTMPAAPPPLEVPAQFFGYATQDHSGKRVAFFTSGDDVLVVPEGDTFLNRFRLVHIGNASADVEEMSTGRHATVPMLQPPDQVTNQGG